MPLFPSLLLVCQTQQYNQEVSTKKMLHLLLSIAFFPGASKMAILKGMQCRTPVVKALYSSFETATLLIEVCPTSIFRNRVRTERAL